MDLIFYDEIYKNNFNLIDHECGVFANVFKNMNDEWTVDIKISDYDRETFKQRSKAMDYIESEFKIKYGAEFNFDVPEIKRPRYKK